MTELQLAWLAGILEGEGSFSLMTAKTGGIQYPVISLSMVDEDVVRKAYEIAGHGKRRRSVSHGHWPSVLALASL